MDETEVTGLPKEKKNFSSHLQLKANDCRGFIPPDLSKRLQKWKKWQIKKSKLRVPRGWLLFSDSTSLSFNLFNSFFGRAMTDPRSRGIINIKVFFSVQSAVHCTLLTHAQTTEQAATGGLVGCLPTDAALMKRCFGDICYRSSSLWRRADSHTLCVTSASLSSARWQIPYRSASNSYRKGVTPLHFGGKLKKMGKEWKHLSNNSTSKGMMTIKAE